MASDPVDFFIGDGSDKQQPVDLLKKFNHAMCNSRITTDITLLKAFGNYLKTHSPAEDWYTNQDTPNTKPAWDNFETVFKTHFPGVQQAKKSPADLERELSKLKLDKKTLVATVAYGGQDAWSHVVFVEKALDLVKRAGLEKMRSSLTGVRDNLPEVFKENISGGIVTWEKFCTEIKAIIIDILRDWVKKVEAKEMKEKEQDEMNNAWFTHLKSLRAHGTIPTSPTARIRNQMSRATITAGPNQNISCPTTLPADPLSANGGQGNLFSPTNASNRAPPTEVQKTALCARIAVFPMQPNTPAGSDSYRDQCHAWLTTFRASQNVNELTGFPLQPGGVPPGLGECYIC